jgi:hypothetical protein
MPLRLVAGIYTCCMILGLLPRANAHELVLNATSLTRDVLLSTNATLFNVVLPEHQFKFLMLKVNCSVGGPPAFTISRNGQQLSSFLDATQAAVGVVGTNTSDLCADEVERDCVLQLLVWTAGPGVVSRLEVVVGKILQWGIPETHSLDLTNQPHIYAWRVEASDLNCRVQVMPAVRNARPVGRIWFEVATADESPFIKFYPPFKFPGPPKRSVE